MLYFALLVTYMSLILILKRKRFLDIIIWHQHGILSDVIHVIFGSFINFFSNQH